MILQVAILDWTSGVKMRAIVAAWIAGMMAILLTGHYLRYHADRSADAIGQFASLWVAPGVFGVVLFFAVARVFGIKPVFLLKSSWAWFALPVVSSYLPIALWYWGPQQ